jgi:dipeptidyl-peptidase-4
MKLSIELVARFPRPGAAVPGKIAYSPDSKSVTYLFSERGDLARDLWQLDLASGRKSKPFSPPDAVTDQNVSREEALRRERLRLRETGVTDYLWAEKTPALFVPIRGDVYRQDGRAWVRRAIDPKVSSDGSRLFFVRDADVWCADASGERRLTSVPAPGITNGLAEYIAQEELGRHTGYWPSPDASWVAFEQADERHIPIYPIVHQGKDKVEIEEHRYPFAGEPNAKVKVGLVSAAGGPVTWLDLGQDEDFYLARVSWHPDGRLFVQHLSRDQKRLELYAFDPRSARGTLLLVEESSLWINLHHDLRFVESTGEFVWASERTGFKHLYLYDREGRLVRPLTAGNWPVDATLALDPKNRRVYFASGKETPVERHVYSVALDGGDISMLTSEHGIHDAVFAPDFTSFVDFFDSRNQPPTVTVRNMDGKARHVLHAPATIEVELKPPELHTLQTRDGATLHAALYRPDKPGPVIVAVYGGPHAQMVQDSWLQTVDLRAQLLRENGFAVLKIDNRGSARRGLEFEGAIAEDMGNVEVQDQVDGVRWLAAQGFDASRVGIYGWSYGGYMSAMALVKAPDVFKVGVAGAPVTSWDGYDTGYTERYMRTPQTNPEGYTASSVMTHVANLRGKLLLIHGMLDENVHFRHTTRLVNALIKANKPYDLLVYPDERHMPRSEKDRVAMETRILEYFLSHLGFA